MYDSYRRNRLEAMKKPVERVVKVRWGQPIPMLPAMGIPWSSPPMCTQRKAPLAQSKPLMPAGKNAQRQKLTSKFPKAKVPSV